jgi:threonine/homoserine/homoserine lactone efflux protein
MTFFLEGLLFGIILAVSLGPIFIALTQTSIERGVLPGLTVGSGIWISDILFVYVFYNFIKRIETAVTSDFFIFWMGISGAVILFLFGIGLLIKKPDLVYGETRLRKRNYIGFWLKGFLINTINPFTFIFWMSVISTYVIGRRIDNQESAIFLITILAVIILSDAGKVYLANHIKQWLTPKHVNQISNFSGIILIIFAIFLGYRVI